MNVFKSGLARDLFKNYVLSYIVMLVLMITLFLGSIALVVASRIYPALSRFENISNKLITNYKDITEDELKKLDGFLIVINENHEIEYRKGNLISDLEKITIENYIKILKPYQFESVSLLKELEVMAIMSKLNTLIITSNDGRKFVISYKYIDGNNKLLAFGVPYNNIYKNTTSISEKCCKIELIILLVFDILVFIGLIYIFAKHSSKKFINPIKILKNRMEDITNGNYGNQVIIKENNELKELADVFNLMSITIMKEKEKNERLQSEKNRLILHISHDLKNPLASILGYSEILLENTEISRLEYLEYLNIINRNSKRANKILVNLFEIASLESDDYKLNTKKLDINEVLREIIADYIPELENKGFNCEFDISEEIHMVQLDEVKFGRAINNIIENAIKYNNKNTTLKIISKKTFYNTEIIISDNGIGIPLKLRNNIFETFVTGNESKDTITGGTGIGLSITKAIIEMHGGSIELVDGGKGTTFRINI